jgi:hypothetical protein
MSTPPASSNVPPCPVATEVCELAVEFLPAMRAGDGQAIASRAAMQVLTCPSDTTVLGEWLAYSVNTACEGKAPGAQIDVYEWHNGKAPFYVTNVDTLANAVSEAQRGSWGPTLRVVAIGCGGTPDDSAPDCAHGGIAVYALPDWIPPSLPPMLPNPTATQASGGKPVNGTVSPGLTCVALVFSRVGEAPEWHVEKFWMPFPNSIPWPIPDGGQFGIRTATGIRKVSLFNYDFG